MNREPIDVAIAPEVPVLHDVPTAPAAAATAPAQPRPQPQPQPQHQPRQAQPVSQDAAIGDIIRRACKLTPEQVEQVLAYQREHQVRFGEAAVALKFATTDDVMWALSQQFHYPFAAAERNALHADLVTVREPFSEQAELFRAVRSQLARKLHALGQRAPVAVVSPDVGDGKSYFAANLAVAFAQLGQRVLLIDADLRTPRQQVIFGIEQPTGLSTALAGRPAKVAQPLRALPTLSVVPAGTLPPNPLELVEHPSFSGLLRDLLPQYDQVLVDTPAFTHGADAAVIASRCGTALAMARQGRSRVAALQDLVGLLRDDAVQVLGMLVSQH